MKPAKKKVAEEEKKAPNLPYTQILKMVQVIEKFFAVCFNYLQVEKEFLWRPNMQDIHFTLKASSSQNSEIDTFNQSANFKSRVRGRMQP